MKGGAKVRYTKILKDKNLLELEGKINSFLNDEINIDKKFLGISTNVYTKSRENRYFAVVVLEDQYQDTKLASKPSVNAVKKIDGEGATVITLSDI